MSKAIVIYASISENGTINGVYGDSGNEIKMREIYDFSQKYILRPKSITARMRIVKAAKRIFNSKKVGYGQATRTSSYNQFKNWYLREIDVIKKCNTDCSMLASICANIGYKQPIFASDTYSGNICERAVKSKKFVQLGAYNELLAGDIVVAPNKHVVICVKGGAWH